MENTMFRFMYFSFLSFSLGGCSDVSKLVADQAQSLSADQSQSSANKLVIRQVTDDFAGSIRTFAEGAYWIDESSGKYLSIQFECLKSTNRDFEPKFTLHISSKVDVKVNSYSQPTSIDAILFKINNEKAQLYNTGYSTPFFTNASLNLTDLVNIQKVEKIVFRFVYGASIRDTFNPNVQNLSQFPSIDVVLDSGDPSTANILADCSGQ